MNFAFKICGVLLVHTHTIIVQAASIINLPQESINTTSRYTEVQKWELEQLQILENYYNSVKQNDTDLENAKKHYNALLPDTQVMVLSFAFEEMLKDNDYYNYLQTLEEEQKKNELQSLTTSFNNVCSKENKQLEELVKESGYIIDVKSNISDHFENITQVQDVNDVAVNVELQMTITATDTTNGKVTTVYNGINLFGLESVLHSFAISGFENLTTAVSAKLKLITTDCHQGHALQPTRGQRQRRTFGAVLDFLGGMTKTATSHLDEAAVMEAKTATRNFNEAAAVVDKTPLNMDVLIDTAAKRRGAAKLKKDVSKQADAATDVNKKTATRNFDEAATVVDRTPSKQPD
eukprot:Pgem_evm1s17408